MRGAISTPAKAILIVVAVPLAAVAGLFSWVFGIKAKLSATEVATYLRDFIEGRGEDWDWDDFRSVAIADPRLEDIRHRAAVIDLPCTDEGLKTLRGLLVEAERLAGMQGGT
jgi:hypothetical protein